MNTDLSRHVTDLPVHEIPYRVEIRPNNWSETEARIEMAAPTEPYDEAGRIPSAHTC